VEKSALQHALRLQELHAAGGLQYQLAARRAGTMTCWQTSAIGTTSAGHRERGAPLGEIANRSAPRARRISGFTLREPIDFAQKCAAVA
jgi:hypothetical protein